MKAILTGTIATGFIIFAVVPDGEAEGIVVRFLNDGHLAEAVDVQDPQSLNSRWPEAAAAGQYFVVFGQGLGNGFSMYGPFADREDAEECGEAERDENEEWEIFELPGEITTEDRFTDILQHQIKWWLRGMGKPPAELDDCSVDHIKGLIGEGYHSGELCVVDTDQREFRGWWEIAPAD